jgi:hypothetical protein
MYYPSSQITSNLYTNGGEYAIKSSGEDYTGYYWKTLNGKFFTGKTPQDTPVQELVILSLTSTVTPNQNPILNSPNWSPNDFSSTEYPKYQYEDKLTPTYNSPSPTQKDYDAGEFTRYFCKKTNEIIYLEIDKDTYTKLVNKDKTYLFQLYQPFKFQWVITGDKEKVYISNKNITRYMIEKFSFPFLNKYLKEDYLKYYK